MNGAVFVSVYFTQEVFAFVIKFLVLNIFVSNGMYATFSNKIIIKLVLNHKIDYNLSLTANEMPFKLRNGSYYYELTTSSAGWFGLRNGH